jgi:hypothetical protein
MPGGRPTVMTDETIRKLEEAFLWGCTDAEACCHAGIGMSTLYDYCQANPVFSDKKETLKNKPTMKAKKIIDLALDDGDLNTAHRVIDRKEGTKVKQDITSGGKPVNTWIVNPVTTSKDG